MHDRGGDDEDADGAGDPADERAEGLHLVETGQIVRARLGQRRKLGIEARAHQNIDDVEATHDEAGQEGRLEQRLDRGLRGQAVEDEDDRGRDHGAKGTGRADRPDGEILVVAEAQHLGQGDEAEKHDLAADDAAHRRHDDRHHGGHDRDAASGAREPHIEALIHVFGDGGAFEQRRHQDEERHRDEDIVGQNAIDALGENAERAGAEIAEQKVGTEFQDHGDDGQEAGSKAQRHADGEQREQAEEEDEGDRSDVHRRRPSEFERQVPGQGPGAVRGRETG